MTTDFTRVSFKSTLLGSGWPLRLQPAAGWTPWSLATLCGIAAGLPAATVD
jgi:hypothetical protein